MGDYENYNEIPDMTATLTITALQQDSEGNYIINDIIYEDNGETMSVVGYTDDINQDAFITHRVLGKPVTSIGDDAFYWCSSLTSITIGNSVTSIGDQVFDRCSSLTDVYYSGTEEQWNNISIESGNSDLINATIHFNYEI